MTRAELKANVDTIVVVIMENRSFDHVLGHLRHSMYGHRRDIDGIDRRGRVIGRDGEHFVDRRTVGWRHDAAAVDQLAVADHAKGKGCPAESGADGRHVEID